jgi:hypothetical protein
MVLSIHTRTYFLIYHVANNGTQKKVSELKNESQVNLYHLKVNGMHPPIMSLWGHRQKVQQFFDINFPFMTLLNGRERKTKIYHFQNHSRYKKWFPSLMKYENIFRKSEL